MFAFVVTLGVTLAFTWSDGTPISEPMGGISTAAVGFASPDVTEANPSSSGTYLVPRPRIVPPAPQAPIPTARPVQLLIPSIGVHRAVEIVGVTRSGVMQQPANYWNAGWFKGSPVPGAPGDSVIEGHAGYPGQPLIFGRLVKLHAGDAIIVVLGDRTRQLFRVESMRSVPVGTLPAGMAEPYGTPRLTLITCTGHFDQGSYSYSQRLVLEARYVGPV